MPAVRVVIVVAGLSAIALLIFWRAGGLLPALFPVWVAIALISWRIKNAANRDDVEPGRLCQPHDVDGANEIVEPSDARSTGSRQISRAPATTWPRAAGSVSDSGGEIRAR